MLRSCHDRRGEGDGGQGAPVPAAFGAALDDEAESADLDARTGEALAERRDEGCSGLVCCAVADGNVRNPALKIIALIIAARYQASRRKGGVPDGEKRLRG